MFNFEIFSVNELMKKDVKDYFFFTDLLFLLNHLTEPANY